MSRERFEVSQSSTFVNNVFAPLPAGLAEVLFENLVDVLISEKETNVREHKKYCRRGGL